MRTAWKWMLVVVGLLCGDALLARTVLATPPSTDPGHAFRATSVVKGTFDEFAVRAQVVPEGFGGSEDDIWFSMQKTKGASDLYVVRNEWQPGATTGWHSHPGYSFIIVTAGTITAYDADDPSCTPHRYSAGTSATMIDANHVHLVRNETADVAQATIVQIVPASSDRRKDEPAPANCAGIE